MPLESEDSESLKILRELRDRVGGDTARPINPDEAGRWDMPLIWHLTHHGEAIHSLRNFVHVLTSDIEKLTKKLDRNENTNQAILKVAHDLTIVNEDIRYSTRHLIECSEQIAKQIGAVVVDKPLLMRDLWYVDTNASELTLIVILTLEAIVFSAGSEVLLRSALFSAMASISDKPILWGLTSGVLGLFSLGAFLGRTRKARAWAAALNAIYLGITGGLTLALQPGALGWVLNAIACFISLWIFWRGPSRAT